MASQTSNAYKLPATNRVNDVPPFTLPTVLFDPWEIELAELIAKARLLTYRQGDSIDSIGGQDRIDAMTTGCLGEMAVRRMFDNPRKEVIYAYGDPGWDTRIKDYRADVKTSATDDYYPDLIVDAQKELAADLFVLAHRLGPGRVRVLGYATQDEVKSREVQRFPNDRLAHVIPAGELWAIQ